MWKIIERDIKTIKAMKAIKAMKRINKNSDTLHYKAPSFFLNHSYYSK